MLLKIKQKKKRKLDCKLRNNMGSKNESVQYGIVQKSMQKKVDSGNALGGESLTLTAKCEVY